MTFLAFLLFAAVSTIFGTIGGYLYAKAKGRRPYFHDLTRPSEDTEHVMRRSIVDPYVGEFPAGPTLPEDKNKTEGLFAVLRKMRHRQ